MTKLYCEGSIVKQKNSKELQQVTSILPSPLTIYRTDTVSCDIYRAKDMFCSQWNSEILQTLVVDARGSYYRYGNLSLLDSYDPKSAIYLVRASYKVFFHEAGQSLPVEEWLSMRFTPVEGVPFGTSDLDECMYTKGSLIEKMRSELFNGATDCLKHVVTISRICGVHPYLANNKNFPVNISKRHHYTALCFALMNQQFLLDSHQRFSYITGLFRDELIEKALTIQTRTGKCLPLFSSAYKMLNCLISEVILNRDASAYIFPGYFLKMDQLVNVLNSCLNAGKISFNILKQYIPIKSEAELATLMHNRESAGAYLYQLKALLQHKGPLGVDASFNGKVLQKLLDSSIEDGPQLKIMEVGKWRDDIKQFFLLYTFL